MDSYDVRFWDTKKIADNASGGRYWFRRPSTARSTASPSRTRSSPTGSSTTSRTPPATGGPSAPAPACPPPRPPTGKWSPGTSTPAATPRQWPNLAPVSRRSVAEALVTVTIALTAKEKGAPEPRVLRRALFAWAFNPATREQAPPREITLALGWAARASLPVSALDDSATVRLALGACAKTLTGKPVAGSTQRRKRSVFYIALGYAVEQGHLASNPVDRIQWTTPAVAQTGDRRIVVSPAQARKLRHTN